MKIIQLSTVVVAACLPIASAYAEEATFDMGVEISLMSDYMDIGLTNSDHDPAASWKISPSYGIFYGEFSGQTIDYGVDEPNLETKFSIGATPEFGNLAVDFNLQRRIKFDDPTADRWLPYVTGTYTFSDAFNVSIGSGYYMFDDSASADYWELYLGTTLTHSSGSSFTGEFYWNPDQDGANNSYFALYGTVSVPFMEKFEAVGKVGLEEYEDEASFASYVWYEARLNYNVNDHVALGVAYHGNTLNSTGCVTQAWTDCDHSVLASLTFKGNLSDFKK